MEELLEFAAIGDLNLENIEDLIIPIVVQPNNIAARRNRADIYGRLNLDELTAAEVQSYFRFKREHLVRLLNSLQIPNIIRTANGHTVSGIEGLCIVLRRLAYPNRLIDLEPLFGLSAQSLSDVFNTVVHIVYNNHSYLLRNLRHLRWLDHNKLQQYAQAVRAKGAPLENCWGFIDGTARAICRPSINQENYYSGHKRHHCVKYQSVLCPDGMVVNLSGAYMGRRHDAGIFRESRLYDQLEQCTVFPNGDNFVLYGDQAYGVRRLLLCPFSNRNLTEEQRIFNIAMSSNRQAVEWGFGKIISEFAFLDFKKNQKLLLQDISEMYKTAMILTNCHTCLYSSQTSQYFNLEPPSLEEYLNYNNAIRQ